MDKDKAVVSKDVDVRDGDEVIFLDADRRRHRGRLRGNMIEQENGDTHLVFRIERKIKKNEP